MLITRGGYEIDDDPRRLDVDAIHAFLSRDATGRRASRVTC